MKIIINSHKINANSQEIFNQLKILYADSTIIEFPIISKINFVNTNRNLNQVIIQ